MNPAGLIARNSCSFSTPASRSTGLKRCASPISSSNQTTRKPLPSPKTVIIALHPSRFGLVDLHRKDERVYRKSTLSAWKPTVPAINLARAEPERGRGDAALASRPGEDPPYLRNGFADTG